MAELTTRLNRLQQRLLGQRVYFDTNGLIYFFDGREPLFTPMAELLAACDRNEFFGFTGDVAVAELMVHPYRTRNEADIARGKAFFARKNFMTVLAHPCSVFDSAARLRAHNGLKLIDALHVATALHAGCRFFVTNDVGISAPQAAGDSLEVVNLVDLLN